jgi:hypothetical protein
MSRHEKGKEEREKRQSYPLPGMDDGVYRRKEMFILKCSLAAGMVISACFAFILYWISRAHQ